MIAWDKKKLLVQYIQEAAEAGARLKKACEVVGISLHSFLRWKRGNLTDRRKGAPKRIPRKLTEGEREIFYAVANEARFRDNTPQQIVETLLEERTYLGSSSTLYRLLREKKANAPRRESRNPRRSGRPQELVATGPNQIWCWDITWLRSTVRGRFFFAYVIIDIFSRKIVGWTIHEYESPELARDLFNRTIFGFEKKPYFVHADNGGPMKGVTLQAFLTSLSVGLSYSRPRVSNDNPFIESWFRTLKYHVTFPKAFENLSGAREWFASFVHSYNTKHRHSAIGYVTPEQKHIGEDVLLLALRQETINEAASLFPERFVRGPRKINPVTHVFLNKAA